MHCRLFYLATLPQTSAGNATESTASRNTCRDRISRKNAHIAILQGQLEEATKQIAKLKDQEPVIVIKTVPVEVIKVVEKQVSDSGANFGIVTDPKHPGQQVNLEDIEKLPDDTSVTLNQYNVFVYKKVIRGLNIYPDWGELTQGNFKLQEIGIEASRRITKDGKYLGAAAAYDVKNKQAKIGLRYAY